MEHSAHVVTASLVHVPMSQQRVGCIGSGVGTGNFDWECRSGSGLEPIGALDDDGSLVCVFFLPGPELPPGTSPVGNSSGSKVSVGLII